MVRHRHAAGQPEKFTPYPFLEGLDKPPMGGFCSIVDQAAGSLEEPGARLLFRAEKAGKYAVMAKGIRKEDLGGYTVIVHEARQP